MKHLLIRLVIIYGLSILIGATAYFYYGSNLYARPTLNEVPQTTVFDLLGVVFVLVVIKFAIYELVGSALLKKSTTYLSKYIFFGAYSIALIIDLISIFMGLQPYYMNLAMFGTIVFSGPLLLMALIVLSIRLLFLKVKSS